LLRSDGAWVSGRPAGQPVVEDWCEGFYRRALHCSAPPSDMMEVTF
jgi:hypothetical protein